jgi:Zn finger protein HypA/HybF involved in hydrogenase expression
MADPTPASPKVERFRCSACSGDMEFDPESGRMKCSSCGHAEAIASPEAAMADPHSFAEAIAPGGAQHAPISEQAIQASCDGCGSVVVFEPPEVAGSCPFCGASIVAEPKAADPLIAPDGVLPVKVTKSAAQTEVQRWLATRWFAPNALQKIAQPEGISGVYLPFWSYASDTRSQYVGERGEHYYETEFYTATDSNGNTVQQSRQVQRTRWYPASGEVAPSFTNLLIPATRAVNQRRLDALEPWDLEALRPYEPAYLAGLKAQRYQIELADGFEKAKAVMEAQIQEAVRQNIGGDEQRIESLRTEYAAVTFLHLLLPVWMGAYQFQAKVYQVLVNARTGEVQGERPYSSAKIALLVTAILLVAAVLWLVAER